MRQRLAVDPETGSEDDAICASLEKTCHAINGVEPGEKMVGKPITVCVINLKGGVGKSTITALLSRYAFNELKKKTF